MKAISNFSLLNRHGIKNIFAKLIEIIKSRLKLTQLNYKARILIYTVPVLLIVLISLFSFTADAVNIPTYKVNKGIFVNSLNETGELRAKNSITIAAPRIRSDLKIIYMIPEGTYVQPGDVVCKFDPTDAINQLKEAESKLEIALSDKEKLKANHSAAMAQMESSLKNAELSYELSKLNLEQIKFEAEIKQQQTKLEHQKNELTFQKTKEEYKSKIIINKSEMDKMNLEIKQRRNDVERAQRDLESLNLTTPAEGLVVYGINWANSGRKFSIGDKPWPGSVLMTLPDLSSMESLTLVNEVDISLVKKDQQVIVKLDAFADSSFTGVVSSVASLGRNKSNESTIKVFEVVVNIKSKSEILKPGMTTSNKIIMNEIPNVVFIPQEAVFKKGTENIVYIKNGSGFDEVSVEIGERNADYVIIKNNLKDGDIVALRDPTIDIENVETDSKSETELPNS